jgi:hypothetical protein
MARNDNMIAALLRERANYENRGKTDRVRQVDKQLKHYGYSPEGDDNDGPQGRTATPQQTAAQGQQQTPGQADQEEDGRCPAVRAPG